MKDRRDQRTFRSTRRGGLGLPGVLLLAGLLVVPGYGLVRMSASLDWRVPTGFALAASTFAYFVHRADKRWAESGEWRISETTLHAAELLGGWPGAFLAQRVFSHKTSKTSYQAVFWMIVGLHQLVALDLLLGWKFARKLIHLVVSGNA